MSPSPCTWAWSLLQHREIFTRHYAGLLLLHVLEFLPRVPCTWPPGVLSLHLLVLSLRVLGTVPSLAWSPLPTRWQAASSPHCGLDLLWACCTQVCLSSGRGAASWEELSCLSRFFRIYIYLDFSHTSLNVSSHVSGDIFLFVCPLSRTWVQVQYQGLQKSCGILIVRPDGAWAGGGGAGWISSEPWNSCLRGSHGRRCLAWLPRLSPHKVSP